MTTQKFETQGQKQNEFNKDKTQQGGMDRDKTDKTRQNIQGGKTDTRTTQTPGKLDQGTNLNKGDKYRDNREKR